MLAMRFRINTIVNSKYPWKRNGNNFILEVSCLKSDFVRHRRIYSFRVSSYGSMHILIPLIEWEFLKNRLYLFVLYGCSSSKITPGRRFPWYRLKIKPNLKDSGWLRRVPGDTGVDGTSSPPALALHTALVFSLHGREDYGFCTGYKKILGKITSSWLLIPRNGRGPSWLE